MWIAVVACSAMLLTDGVYCRVVLADGLPIDWEEVARRTVPLGIGLIGAAWVLRANAGNARSLVPLLGAFAALLGAFVSSHRWFDTPMHDVALWFGSHGRWGCEVIDQRGHYYYWVRQGTAPFIVFAPGLTALGWTAARALRSARRRSG